MAIVRRLTGELAQYTKKNLAEAIARIREDPEGHKIHLIEIKAAIYERIGRIEEAQARYVWDYLRLKRYTG